MAGWSSYSYAYGPLVALIPLGVLVLLLRWAFGRGGSVVAPRASAGPASDYGLLVAVSSPRSAAQAQQQAARLVAAGLRATVAPTTDGPRVMVFAGDVDAARAVLTA